MQRTSKCILSHITQNEKKRKKTDILYMKKILTFAMSAALAALLPMLHRRIHIAEQDIRLYPDFEARGRHFKELVNKL